MARLICGNSFTEGCIMVTFIHEKEEQPDTNRVDKARGAEMPCCHRPDVSSGQNPWLDLCRLQGMECFRSHATDRVSSRSRAFAVDKLRMADLFQVSQLTEQVGPKEK